MKCAGAAPLLAPCQSLPSRGAWVEIVGGNYECTANQSLPSRGAWVEISGRGTSCIGKGSLPSRGAWVEISMAAMCLALTLSLPSRGAWVEMRDVLRRGRSPRGERGLKSLSCMIPPKTRRSLPSRGAWVEIALYALLAREPPSLPSRGAWVEIVRTHHAGYIRYVAPLAGSVG